jgi:hypothetical protein
VIGSACDLQPAQRLVALTVVIIRLPLTARSETGAPDVQTLLCGHTWPCASASARFAPSPRSQMSAVTVTKS